ncbi:hypothetical protein [Salinarimonas chemoclinalis]|uniref:hypothetical protein n=1 Tax=Salinarimonas chemoclinalis TaxID=3241599 RepID=UPI0035577B74
MAEHETEQQKAAKKALETKRRNDPHADIPEHRTADEGMHPHDGPKAPPSGALDHGGAAPALSRSHGTRRTDQGAH